LSPSKKKAPFWKIKSFLRKEPKENQIPICHSQYSTEEDINLAQQSWRCCFQLKDLKAQSKKSETVNLVLNADDADLIQWVVEELKMRRRNVHILQGWTIKIIQESVVITFSQNINNQCQTLL